MKRSWARRTAELRGEIAAIAEPDPRWWLLAGGVAAAEPWGARQEYVRSDAEPGEDTFLGIRVAAPRDPIADAIARARAARTAVRELDGQLPDQRLAVTVKRTTGTVLAANTLEVAAFAIGDQCLVATLDDPTLPRMLAGVIAGIPAPAWRGETPFVCVSIGDDPIAVARHGHRRAWLDGTGPWLGIGRTGELATVSTCHLVVDGYGHARITGRIAELVATPSGPGALVIPPLAPVTDAIPLGVAWRALAGSAPHVLRLAYALGQSLHRMAGRRAARFSPTFQIPIAPGDRSDPLRIRRRGVPGIVSVRFDAGMPEPFEAFEARAREVLAREADGEGLCSRLLAAARGTPAPLAWKRKGISATRPRWLDRISDVIGGRACLSKIRIDAPLAAACAVSSPARLASSSDELGGCVVTVVDDGTHASITACGSGMAGTAAAAAELIDELLARV
ncbi:MAG: hypothetical protein ABI867_22545 [Kofleriaceae bacterium]